LHSQLGEQLHDSPQLHPLVWTAAFAFWHPHLQVAPAQDAHWQVFVFDGMESPYFSLSCFALVCANNCSVASEPPIAIVWNGCFR
jgi:hypothetical protein